MKIIVNMQELEFEALPSGAELLNSLGITPATVVAELNGQIIKRDEFLVQRLAEGDVLELVTVVGGG